MKQTHLLSSALVVAACAKLNAGDLSGRIDRADSGAFLEGARYRNRARMAHRDRSGKNRELVSRL